MALGDNHLDLAPSAQDRQIAFALPKALDPYVVVWFNARKLDGESVADFVCRWACKEGVRYQQLTVLEGAQNDHKAACDATDELLNTDNATLHAEAKALLDE